MMPHKQVRLRSVAREEILLGATQLIDATKVGRMALANATSVASVLLLTEATMTEIPESKKEPEAAS